MKKIIYIALMASGMLLNTSCVDLDQEPLSFPSEEGYYSDLDKIQKAATGLTTSMWASNYGFNCRAQILGLGADDITYSPTKANNRYAYFKNLSPEIDINKDDVTIMWDLCLTVINNANSMIEKVQIPSDDKIKTKYEEALGEAYFMRGLAYFYLVRFYGDVPLLLKISDAETRMPRSSVADIYDKVIVPSLEQAVSWLPEKSRSKTSSTPSKSAAKACLTDVYLTMAGWPLNKGKEYYSKAAEISKGIIDNAQKNGLSLTKNYPDLWKEAKKKEANEHLFALHHSSPYKVPSNYGKSYYPKDFYPNAGWADYYSEEKFYLDYPKGARKEWNFMSEWEAGNKDAHKVINYKESIDGLPAISKYYDYNEGDPGKSAQANGITSIYRYADVLLMYAEASTQATGTVNELAAKCLKDVQERAGSSIVTNTTNPEAFLKAVFDENGWEFFAEMRRWFDLVRLEKVSEVSTKWDNSLYKANNHYYMPIPESQILLTGWTNNAGY